MENNPGTQPQPAAATVMPPRMPTPEEIQESRMPRHKQVERQGSRAEPYTRRHPQVRGGVCDHCGIIDPNVPAEHQYKLCQHYRGMQLRCSYCDENKDPNETVYHAVLNVADSPQDPNTLIVWCNAFECSRRHEQRFRRNA